MMNGIGRKIRLWPEYEKDDKTAIKGFLKEMCYIKEGQFVDDEIEGFGRVVSGGGAASIGWMTQYATSRSFKG